MKSSPNLGHDLLSLLHILLRIDFCRAKMLVSEDHLRCFGIVSPAQRRAGIVSELIGMPRGDWHGRVGDDPAAGGACCFVTPSGDRPSIAAHVIMIAQAPRRRWTFHGLMSMDRRRGVVRGRRVFRRE